ncbi:MAG: hypothetical protein JWQ87_779 [Candidatus Sulfotelmatobacter sp.]|nr:hypothetical protein [Candidatus Sulfotelmatobacter sp.]
MFREKPGMTNTAEERRFRLVPDGCNLHQFLEYTDAVAGGNSGIKASQWPRSLLFAHQSGIETRLQRRWSALLRILRLSKNPAEFPVPISVGHCATFS